MKVKTDKKVVTKREFAKNIRNTMDAVTGDSGSGGQKGVVPAPSAGDAAAGKFLKADGSWAVTPVPTSSDLGLTTQGDLLYRDASGLARLAAGTAGQILQTNGASANPSWATPNWTIVTKTNDQSRASTTTLADDAALTFAVAASTKYRFRITVFYLTNTTADFKWQLTGPSTPTAVHYVGYDTPDGDALNARGRTAFSSSISETSTGATGGSIIVTGILQNSTNAGTIVFQWAQNTSDPGNTTVQAGSFIEYATV